MRRVWTTGNIAPRLIALAVCAPAILNLGEPAMAADVKADSRIDSVIVFPQGAEVTRVLRVKLEKGDSTLVIADLPAEAVKTSIRVEGKATGRLEIGAVDSRQLVVPRQDAAQLAGERRRLEDEIERLRDDKTRLQAQIDATAAQKEFIKSLSNLPGRPGAQPDPSGRPALGQDWGQIIALIGTGLVDVEARAMDARIKMRELDRQIDERSRAVAKLAPAPQEHTEVRVAVAADAPLEADMTVKYQVGRASWLPGYDARLDTGTKTQAPSLKLVRRAMVSQRTTESWENVALVLSTTRPGAGTSAPEIGSLTVDYPPDVVPMAAAPPMVGAAPVARSIAKSAAIASGEMDAEAMDRVQLQSTVAQAVTADIGAYQAQFSLPTRSSVPNSGEMKRIVIEETQVEPQLIVKAVPKREERAYLYAKLQLPKGAPYLPGQVALFRDQTFVGNGQIPQLSAGEDHELGFGADDAVRVKYAVANEKRGATGIISTSKTEDRSFKITIKNLHPRQVAYSILDQIPVSKNDDIKVDFTAKVQPARRDIDDKRGVIAFEDKLAPDEERVIEFATRVSWPSAKNIQYGR